MNADGTGQRPTDEQPPVPRLAHGTRLIEDHAMAMVFWSPFALTEPGAPSRRDCTPSREPIPPTAAGWWTSSVRLPRRTTFLYQISSSPGLTAPRHASWRRGPILRGVQTGRPSSSRRSIACGESAGSRRSQPTAPALNGSRLAFIRTGHQTAGALRS